MVGNKKRKQNIKGCVLGLAWWACVWSRPSRKKKKEESPFGLCGGLRGPKGVGGPPEVSQLSCRSSKILVSILGKFRRFGEYINSIRYLDETYY